MNVCDKKVESVNIDEKKPININRQKQKKNIWMFQILQGHLRKVILIRIYILPYTI